MIEIVWTETGSVGTGDLKLKGSFETFTFTANSYGSTNNKRYRIMAKETTSGFEAVENGLNSPFAVKNWSVRSVERFLAVADAIRAKEEKE